MSTSGRLVRVLRDLRAAAKVKAWGDPPEGSVECDGWLLTCSIENGYVVLGISVTDAAIAANCDSKTNTTDLLIAVGVVFGEPADTVQARYSNRGYTTLFRWKLP